jgi:hypothetical protein
METIDGLLKQVFENFDLNTVSNISLELNNRYLEKYNQMQMMQQQFWNQYYYNMQPRQFMPKDSNNYDNNVVNPQDKNLN